MNNLLSRQQPIKDIARPILENTDIDFFCYDRLYPDNTGFFLTTHPQINKTLVEKNAYSSHSKVCRLMTENKEINFLHNIFYALLKEENINAENLIKEYGFKGGTLEIIDWHKDGYFEALSFSTKNSESLTRFCFTNWDIIIQFKNYFLNKAEELIADSCQNRIKMGAINKNTFHENILETDMTLNREACFKNLEIDHYYLMHKGERVKLTKKEFQCLKCCAQGRKDKETARITGLSAKTVEHYLNKLKNDFYVHTRSELIDIYLISDLIVL